MSLQVERYRQTQEVIRLVEHLQGEVEVEAEGWRRESLGDFAQLSERILTIRLNRPSHTSQSLEEIVRFPEAIESVRLLDLGDSRIDDDAIAPVLQFSRLLQLDVRGTKLSHAGIRNLIRSLKHLEAINVHGTPYGLLSQWRQRISRRRPRCLASPTRPFNAAPPEHRDLMGIPPLS